MNLAQYFVKRGLSFIYDNGVYEIQLNNIIIKMQDKTYPWGGYIGEIIFAKHMIYNETLIENIVFLKDYVTFTYGKTMVTLKQLNRLVKRYYTND